MGTYRAQIDDFSFEIKSDGVSDVWTKNVVEYEIPFSSGASLDSLGVKSRPIRFVAIFRKENYESHQAFIAHALIDQYNTLIHPVYGPVTGMIKSLSVAHDDRLNYCEISIEFVAEAIESAAPVYAPSITQLTEEALVAGQLQCIANLQAELSAGLGAGASVSLAQDLDSESETALLNQMNLTLVQRIYLRPVEDLITKLNSILPEVPQPDSILSSINYGLSLPGLAMQALSRAMERCAVAAIVSGSPLSFITSFRSNVDSLTSGYSMLIEYIKTAAAQIECVTISKLYQTDEDFRAKLEKIENAPVWGEDGRLKYIPELPPVLTMDELELSLALVCEDIQAAIDQIREGSGSIQRIFNLKKMADALKEHVNEIKLKRERIVTIQVLDPVPVHLLCLQYGLPYMAAERICAINNFWCPNFISGEVKMYV